MNRGGTGHRGFFICPHVGAEYIPPSVVRARRARGTQLAQEKPLEQLEADGQATSGDPEVLAKLDNRRSTLFPSHFGHFTPSLPAPIFCKREKSFPHSLHRYS